MGTPVTDQGTTKLNRWLNLNLMSALTRTRGYIQIPAFSVTVTWSGRSTIVGVFNYAASHDFSLLDLGALPDPQQGYELHVMYVNADGSVARYRLLADTRSIISSDFIPEYTGQLIKRNFRIEVWSTSAGNAVSASVIGPLITSVLSPSEDRRNGVDFELVSASNIVTNFGCTILNSGDVTLPTTNLFMRFDAGAGVTVSGTDVTHWVEQVTGTYDVTPGVGYEPTMVLPESAEGLSLGLKYPMIKFMGDDYLQNAVAFPGSKNIAEVYLVTHTNWSGVANLGAENGTPRMFAMAQASAYFYARLQAALGKFRFYRGNEVAPYYDFVPGMKITVVDMNVTSGSVTPNGIYGLLPGTASTTVTTALTCENIVFGDTGNAGVDCGFGIHMLLAYSTVQSAADRAQTLLWIATRFNSVVWPLPLTFGSATIVLNTERYMYPAYGETKSLPPTPLPEKEPTEPVPSSEVPAA